MPEVVRNIVTGFSCAAHEAVFGHYLKGDGSDPWAGKTYRADGSGVATINDVFPGTSLTLFDAVPVFGRTVVVHEDNAAQGNPRCGCGVVGGAFGVHSAMMTTARYPEYTGGYLPEVLAWLSEASGTLTMRARLTGLEPGARGGFHIHFHASQQNSHGHIMAK